MVRPEGVETCAAVFRTRRLAGPRLAATGPAFSASAALEVLDWLIASALTFPHMTLRPAHLVSDGTGRWENIFAEIASLRAKTGGASLIWSSGLRHTWHSIPTRLRLAAEAEYCGSPSTRAEPVLTGKSHRRRERHADGE